MIHIVEKALDVKFYYVICQTMVKSCINICDCVFDRAFWSESIAVFAEVCLTYWFQYLLETLLNESVPNARDSQWARGSIGLWYVLSSNGFWSVASFCSRNDISDFSGHFFGRHFANIRDCQFICSGCFVSCVVFNISVREQNIFKIFKVLLMCL